MTIDEIPVEWLCGPGALVDLSDAMDDFDLYTPKMIEDRVEVKKGDLLFQIDPRPFEAQVAAAESQISAARSQLDLARTELARNEQMWADRATSKREFDDAATRVRTLEAQLKSN